MKTLLLALGSALALASYASRPSHAEPGTMTVLDPVSSGIIGETRTLMGRAGTWLVGGLVNSMTVSTDQSVNDLRVALKKKDGPDGRRAREAAKTALQLDSIARDHLQMLRPVAAVNTAMKARGYLDVTKRNLGNP